MKKKILVSLEEEVITMADEIASYFKTHRSGAIKQLITHRYDIIAKLVALDAIHKEEVIPNSPTDDDKIRVTAEVDVGSWEGVVGSTGDGAELANPVSALETSNTAVDVSVAEAATDVNSQDDNTSKI